MIDIYSALRNGRFVKPQGIQAFISRNQEEIFKLIKDGVSDEGAFNLRDLANFVADYYNYYESGETNKMLKNMAENNSSFYGLNLISLESGLKLTYPEFFKIKIIVGESKNGRGRGRVDLSRFLYEDIERLKNFFRNSCVDTRIVEKKSRVINVSDLFVTDYW